MKRQIDIQATAIELKKLILNLSQQADFPDSGYFYSQIQRKADALHDELEQAIGKKFMRKFMKRVMKRANKLSYQYYQKICFVDKDGRGWTASDMDAAMCR